jgi:hypothetical protein
MKVGRALALLAFTFMVGWLAAPALAQEGPTPPPAPPVNDSDGLAFLIISLDDTFVFTGGSEPTGSPTIVVSIGTLAGGPEVGNTRFVTAGGLVIPVTADDLPDGITFESLGGNEVTVLGTFQTTEDPEVHLVTADPGSVVNDIEQAVYNATRSESFDDLFWDSEGGTPLFPTTVQIAEFIAGFPPLAEEPEPGEGEEFPPPPPWEASSTDTADVAEAIFETDDVLNLNDETTPTVEADGEMFPHPDAAPVLFTYAIEADEDGNFTSDVCLIVEIDIKPGSDPNSINLKKQGSLPVAILSSDTFDATDVDEGTVVIVGIVGGEEVSVGPVVKNNGTLQCSVEDVDDDGDDDLVCHFSVPELKEAGLLDANTVKLVVRGEDFDGGCILGADSVKIVTK